MFQYVTPGPGQYIVPGGLGAKPIHPRASQLIRSASFRIKKVWAVIWIVKLLMLTKERRKDFFLWTCPQMEGLALVRKSRGYPFYYAVKRRESAYKGPPTTNLDLR